MLPSPMARRRSQAARAAAPAPPSRPRSALQATLVTTRTTLQAAPGARFAQDTLSAIRAVIHGFRGERISLRAAALTYISIFSLVPMLTVALVLLQTLNYADFRGKLEWFIQEILAPGVREESSEFFRSFLARASAVGAGGVGFLVLAFSAGMLLKNLESSLNDIWNVRRTRPWHVRVVIYGLILLIAPVLVAVSLAGSGAIRQSLELYEIPYFRQMASLGSLGAAVGVFTVLYYFAPNAPVRLRSALAGGLVAGTAWDLARFGYTLFGSKIFQYNPVYGSLGALPLFLAWIYVSWLLVLFGARLAYAVEHAVVPGLIRELGEHPRGRELLAARMAQLITTAQYLSKEPPSPRDLSRSLGVPEDRARQIAERMEAAGLLATAARGGLVPARLPEQLTLADLSAAVGGLPPAIDGISKSEELRMVEELFASVDDSARRALGRVTWAELAATTPHPVDPPTEQVALDVAGNP
ncbi:MAG: YihY family inner membrane protein [Myxococcota bacterium]|nr:YihY family inner membrane protein [Myxococcota bacterium]